MRALDNRMGNEGICSVGMGRIAAQLLLAPCLIRITVRYSSLFKITMYCHEACTSAGFNFLGCNSVLQVKLSEWRLQQGLRTYVSYPRVKENIVKPWSKLFTRMNKQVNFFGNCRNCSDPAHLLTHKFSLQCAATYVWFIFDWHNNTRAKWIKNEATFWTSVFHHMPGIQSALPCCSREHSIISSNNNFWVIKLNYLCASK